MKPIHYALLAAASCLHPCYAHAAATEYVIEAASNDEKFLVNDEFFSAKTYCLGWEKGDRIVFLEGDPSGACTDATLYNRRMEETCELWCGD